MCCANWKFMGVLAALAAAIFVAQPGIDTAGVALAFAAVAGGLKWLEARGLLMTECELPQPKERSRTGRTGIPSEGHAAVLQAQLATLEQEVTALRREIARREREERGFSQRPAAGEQGPADDTAESAGDRVLPGARR